MQTMNETMTDSNNDTHETHVTNGNGKGKRQRAALTVIKATAKISEILDQFSTTDQKRILAFLRSESDEHGE